MWLQMDLKARVSIDAQFRIALCRFMLLRLHCTAVPMVGPSHHCADLGVLTMPDIRNLGSITRKRFTLMALPLKVIDVEASPVRAVALED
jgi:hypothetical protein